MRNYTRFISGEEVDAVSQWRFGDLDVASMLRQDREQAQAQQVIAAGVLELACELSRQILRHELSIDPYEQKKMDAFAAPQHARALRSSVHGGGASVPARPF